MTPHTRERVTQMFVPPKVLDGWRVAHRMCARQKGRWRLTPFTVTGQDAMFDALRATIQDHGRWSPPGDYIKLERKAAKEETEAILTGGWTTVMSDTPDEMADHIDVLRFGTGRVLIHGLGLGCVVGALLAKDDVEHIDVVEVEPDVIALTGHAYADGRVTIHEGSAAEMRWPRGTRWNYVWHDIWSFISEDNLSDDSEAEHGISYARLHRMFARRCDRQGSWGFEQAHWQRRRMRRFDQRADRFTLLWNEQWDEERRVRGLIEVLTPPLSQPGEWAEHVAVLPAPGPADQAEGKTMLDSYRERATRPMTVNEARMMIYRD